MRSFSDPGWDADRGVRIAGGDDSNKEGEMTHPCVEASPGGLARLPGAIVRYRPLTVVRVVSFHGPPERVYTSLCRSNPFAPWPTQRLEIYQARFVCCEICHISSDSSALFQIRRVQNTQRNSSRTLTAPDRPTFHISALARAGPSRPSGVAKDGLAVPWLNDGAWTGPAGWLTDSRPRTRARQEKLAEGLQVDVTQTLANWPETHGYDSLIGQAGAGSRALRPA